MRVTIEIVQWVEVNYDWTTKIGTPAVRITAPRDYLVTIEAGGVHITVKRAELRAALDALDAEMR